MKERWRVVPGTSQRYWVSDRGDVWTVGRPPGQWGGSPRKPGLMRTYPHVKGGYPMVTLYFDGRRRVFPVHTLVALAFYGPRPAGHVVRHLNDVPWDNRLVNLSYGTYAENEADKYRNHVGGDAR